MTEHKNFFAPYFLQLLESFTDSMVNMRPTPMNLEIYLMIENQEVLRKVQGLIYQ